MILLTQTLPINESHIYNKTHPYKPLNIFGTLNKSISPPTGYKTYSQKYMEGLIEGLIGLKEGQTSVINISAEKAYGSKKLKVGDTFSTTFLTASSYNNPLNQTVEVLNLTNENIALKWLNVQGLGNFTFPEAILKGEADIKKSTSSFYDALPPYFIWENSSMIINVTNANVLIKTTPTKTQNLTKQITLFSIAGKFGGFIFPDATTAEWNESKIIFRHSPIPGLIYTLNLGGRLYNITVENVTTTHVNVSIEYQGKNQFFELNRTIEFNRTYSMPRFYIIPLNYFQYIFGSDIQKAGYGITKLAGERLLFKITIVKVYKTSQKGN